MSAYVVVEFTVKDPEMYREKYAPIAGQTAKEHGGEVIAAGNREVLHGDGSLTSGALVRFTDRETALGWYDSPEYQQLIDVGVSRWMSVSACWMVSLRLRPQKMNGNPNERVPRKDGAHHRRQRRARQGGGPTARATTA